MQTFLATSAEQLRGIPEAVAAKKAADIKMGPPDVIQAPLWEILVLGNIAEGEQKDSLLRSLERFAVGP